MLPLFRRNIIMAKNVWEASYMALMVIKRHAIACNKKFYYNQKTDWYWATSAEESHTATLKEKEQDSFLELRTVPVVMLKRGKKW